MKIYLSALTALIIVLLSFNLCYSQHIGFATPQNGQTFIGAATETSVPVNVFYSYTTTPYPPAYSVSSFAKLITHNDTYSSAEGQTIPQLHYVAPGTYNWRLELWEQYYGESSVRKTAEVTVTFYVKHTLTVGNNFGGGTISIDGAVTSSWSSAYKFTGNNLPVSAIDQNYGGRNQVWNTSGVNNSNWQRKRKNESSFSDLSGASSRNYNYTVTSNDNGASIQAAMKPKYNVTFANSFSGASGGTINVGGSTYSAPTSSFQVTQLNQITATAQYHVINGIQYTFDHWSDGSSSNPKSFTISNDQTITAYFTGRPDKAPLSTSINSSQTGQPVRLNWTEHPNTAVTQYAIYRGAKVDGNFSNPVQIATVSRGTTTYTDYNFIIGGSSPNSVCYDVVPYYSTEGTWGLIGGSYVVSATKDLMQKTNDSTSVAQSLPQEYALANYPNPFNPSTNINFSIPEAANVKLTIYNMLGEKVKELLNRNMEAGSYTAQWNGDDQSGSKVISGIYFSVLQTNNKRIVQKMVLSK